MNFLKIVFIGFIRKENLDEENSSIGIRLNEIGKKSEWIEFSEKRFIAISLYGLFEMKIDYDLSESLE